MLNFYEILINRCLKKPQNVRQHLSHFGSPQQNPAPAGESVSKARLLVGARGGTVNAIQAFLCHLNRAGQGDKLITLTCYPPPPLPSHSLHGLVRPDRNPFIIPF
jgi:hypothetical protein